MINKQIPSRTLCAAAAPAVVDDDFSAVSRSKYETRLRIDIDFQHRSGPSLRKVVPADDINDESSRIESSSLKHLVIYATVVMAAAAAVIIHPFVHSLSDHGPSEFIMTETSGASQNVRNAFCNESKFLDCSRASPKESWPQHSFFRRYISHLSIHPSIHLSIRLSIYPSILPSLERTDRPNDRPTDRPSVRSSVRPSNGPSTSPCVSPSDRSFAWSSQNSHTHIICMYPSTLVSFVPQPSLPRSLAGSPSRAAGRAAGLSRSLRATYILLTRGEHIYTYTYIQQQHKASGAARRSDGDIHACLLARLLAGRSLGRPGAQ